MMTYDSVFELVSFFNTKVISSVEMKKNIIPNWGKELRKIYGEKF